MQQRGKGKGTDLLEHFNQKAGHERGHFTEHIQYKLESAIDPYCVGVLILVLNIHEQSSVLQSFPLCRLSEYLHLNST